MFTWECLSRQVGGDVNQKTEPGDCGLCPASLTAQLYFHELLLFCKVKTPYIFGKFDLKYERHKT